MFWYQMKIVNPICFGDGVTWEHIHDVVVNYLEEHPERGQEHALILVTWAIREAFDCPEPRGRSMENEEYIDDGGRDGAVGARPRPDHGQSHATSPRP
jgi:hypothetical protein